MMMATKLHDSEVFLSLAQAASVTGSSEGRVRYNKEKLVGEGATVSEDGWRIPASALVTLGWVDEDTLTERMRSLSLSQVQQLELEVARLRAENERLRAEVEEHAGSFSSRLFGGRRRK